MSEIIPFTSSGCYLSVVHNPPPSDPPPHLGGVLGDLVLWNLTTEVAGREFSGHNGAVLAVAVPMFTTSSSTSTSCAEIEPAHLVSSAEKLFLSIGGGQDSRVLCWDEGDQTSGFQFRCKETAEVHIPSLPRHVINVVRSPPLPWYGL